MLSIDINGKTLKLQFGMHVAEFMGPLFSEQIGGVEKSAILISLAHENYLKANRTEVKQMDEGEIYAAIEAAIIEPGGEVLTADVAKVWAAFRNSALMKSLVDKLNATKPKEEPKKKVAPGKTSKRSPSGS